MNIAAELNISLEPHLLDALTPIPPLIPASLASKLIPYLSEPRLPTIPYLILQSISQWSRTPSGLSSLQSHSPPLDPQSYTMIALLAGTTTSPERRFAEYVRKKEPEELEVERKRERKAITALLNALLSIGGSAVATWWAAEKTGWKNEWRVLASLFVAIVVATSEAVLYTIWQSRRLTSKPIFRRGRKIASAKQKKDDGDTSGSETIDTSMLLTEGQERAEGLRQRVLVEGNVKAR